MITIETANERWKKARQELGYSQGKLATILNVTQPTISGYEKGLSIPPSAIRAFSGICHVRESYLLNGDLPILEPPKEQTPAEQIMEKLNLPEICAAALEVWGLLPESEQETIKRAIQDTIDRYNAQHPPDEPSK